MNSSTLVSERIKQSRKAAKLTQEELGRRVNTTKATISNYENGYSTPSNQMLVELSGVLNVTTDYLLSKDNIEATNIQTFDIGYKLKKLRVSGNMTQKQFGEMFRLAESTISMYERDERKPDYETLIHIADHFDVSVDFLLGRDANQENEALSKMENNEPLNDNNQFLGKRLKQLRIEKKITQLELGKIINVTHVSISGYESGNRFPDINTLERLADYFNVQTDYLLGRNHQIEQTKKQGRYLGEELLLENEYIFLQKSLQALRDIKRGK